MYIYKDKGNFSSFHKGLSNNLIRKVYFKKKNQYMCFIKLLLSFNHQLVLYEINNILLNNNVKFTQEIKNTITLLLNILR